MNFFAVIRFRIKAKDCDGIHAFKFTQRKYHFDFRKETGFRGGSGLHFHHSIGRPQALLLDLFNESRAV